MINKSGKLEFPDSPVLVPADAIAYYDRSRQAGAPHMAVDYFIRKVRGNPVPRTPSSEDFGPKDKALMRQALLEFSHNKEHDWHERNRAYAMVQVLRQEI